MDGSQSIYDATMVSRPNEINLNHSVNSNTTTTATDTVANNNSINDTYHSNKSNNSNNINIPNHTTNTNNSQQQNPQNNPGNASEQPTMSQPMHQSSSFSFENFHLDPQDFQNFLLINPPLTEYSSHYYMNLSNNNINNNQTTNNNSNIHTINTANNNTIKSVSNISPTSSDENSNNLLKPMSTINDPLLNNDITADLNFYTNNETNIPITQNQNQISTSSMITNNSNNNNNNNNNNSYEGIHANSKDSVQQIPGNSNNSSKYSYHQQQNYNINTTTTTNNNNNINTNPFGIDFDIDQQLPLPSRRLSISNGQIGQISMMVHSQLYPTSNASETASSVNSTSIIYNEENNNVNNSGIQQLSKVQNATQNLHSNSNSNQIPVQNLNQNSSGLNNNSIEVDNNGVPTRQLIYNNEVIFNPNGPIPGTNAWKRAKILERNRIAASKCRAKKKNLQKKLQQNVDDLNDENTRLRDMLNEMKRRAERYCKFNNVSMSEIFASNIEIKKEDEDEKMKKLKAQHTNAHVDVFIKDGFL